jgi:tetratricopeptide (TPR) repeat protein
MCHRDEKLLQLTPLAACATLLAGTSFMTHRRPFPTQDPVRRLLAGVFLVTWLPAVGLAQRPAGGDPTVNPGSLVESLSSYRTEPGTAVLVFSVSAERSSTHLDRQAVLTLVNRANHASLWTTTQDQAKAVFTNIAYGTYDLEVSAVGYLSTHKELLVMDTLRPLESDIVLQRDPSAINLDVAETVMSPKARKEARRAISLLKSNKLDSAQKQLTQAYQLAPSSPDLNFLLGYVYFQKKDFGQAENYLNTAASLNPHNAQTLTLLGRTGLEREDYPAAKSALEQAVLADADNWLPHNLLADTYLHQKDYGKARDEAKVAIARGNAMASPAQIVLGEALVGLGQDHEGIQALNTFMEQSPRHPLATQVRTLIAELNEQSAARDVPLGSTVSANHLASVDPLAAISAPNLLVQSWQPPGIDQIQPAKAPAVTCPSAQVIEESGRHVQELVNDVARFSAIEDLFHQSLDNFGIPIRTETRKYNYVASIAAPEPGILLVDEYRADKLDVSGYPDQIASTGFVALALVFHPDMRDNFEMTCEGLGDWHGQASWLVHFRQRDDRPNRMQSYKVGSQIHSVPLKGRAWITADKFQIVHIEAEMVHPMPEIQLLSEHQVVEYGPVPFAQKNTTLWLPKSAEIYFDLRKHHYYRRHSFDHYMLYSVDTQEKRKEPTDKPAKQPTQPGGVKSPA